MANEELQRRSRRVRVFWIVTAALAVIAIVVSMLPDAIEADVARLVNAAQRCAEAAAAQAGAVLRGAPK